MLRAIRAVVARPPFAPPGHYYSPLTSAQDARRALAWEDGAPDVELAEDRQVALAERLRAVLAEPLPGPRYAPANPMFGLGDAAVYRAMLGELRPARLIEVGSGFSTAVVLDEMDANPSLAGLDVTCVEPYPARLRQITGEADLARLTLIRRPVQDVGVAIYDRLCPGDLLFIDSTHVVKAGSDVVWLFLHVLPRLAPGVLVHVHDVFWPFEYPPQWLRQRRDWNEAYLVRAFLSGNSHWEIVFFADWFWRRHPERVPSRLAAEAPGSLWLRKRG